MIVIKLESKCLYCSLQMFLYYKTEQNGNKLVKYIKKVELGFKLPLSNYLKFSSLSSEALAVSVISSVSGFGRGATCAAVKALLLHVVVDALKNYYVAV